MILGAILISAWFFIGFIPALIIMTKSPPEKNILWTVFWLFLGGLLEREIKTTQMKYYCKHTYYNPYSYEVLFREGKYYELNNYLKLSNRGPTEGVVLKSDIPGKNMGFYFDEYHEVNKLVGRSTAKYSSYFMTLKEIRIKKLNQLCGEK